ncbi:MAG: multidrug efflux RND transporter permease subunit [Polyangiaceae bacterium]|nr:multidrug efflux RND transporter permease subunit [Polyangiaceae bacterium]
MSISAPFVRRPVATTLLMVGVTLTGVVAFSQLPVSALPEVDYPTIVVSTYLPGASADTMASSVTTPLERQLGQMPSLSSMTSVSSYGYSQITLQFELERQIDAAEQDVQAAINAAANLLPQTLPAPPTYSKSNPAESPILTLAVSSDTLELRQVADFADSILAQKIAQVSGVGLVTLNGGQKPAVVVRVDPEALAGARLTLEDVRASLVAANANQPKGSLDGPRQNYVLDTDDELPDAKAFRPIIIGEDNGAPIRLADIATVEDGVENAELAGWADDKRAVILNVQRQPGANVIEVADRVKELLPQLSASLPQSLDVRVLADRTETVRASVEEVEWTLALTVALVVLVMFVFLRNLRATVIPGIAVPLSLIGTFGAMYLLGFSLNNLTLMALTISTGFVVDDAIVMIENVTRHIERGAKPFEAALAGAKEIGFTIVSLTVSLVAVLIPLLFMGGVVGRLFREFAITLAVAITVSAFLSLTLTPMMCAHLLRPGAEEQHPSHASSKPRFWSRPLARVKNGAERGYERMLQAYDRSLGWVLKHRTLALLVTFATAGLTAMLALAIPKGFFPPQDTGAIVGVTEAAPDVSFERMVELQRRVADAVRSDPDVQSVASFIGADGTNMTPNTGRLSITLKPRSERKSTAQEIVARLGPKVSSIEGMQLHAQAVQDLQIDATVSRTQYQYTLQSADAEELAAFAPRFVAALSQEPELEGVTSDQGQLGLAVDLAIDRDTASRLGVTAQAIDDTLYDAFGQRQISTIFTQLNLYRVILQVTPDYQRDEEALDRLHVRSTTGEPVTLRSFAHWVTRPVPIAITHDGQFPAVTVSFNTARGASLGDAVTAISRAEEKVGVPRGVHGKFRGEARAFQESLASEPLLVLAALITVYIVLGVLYESTIHPITILSTLPSAGVGAFLALVIARIDFGVVALIGIILLIGIVKKNAIMMIDFALEAEREQKMPPAEAIHQACLLRFRPIMMTTMAALLGALPLALGSGTGSELRRPLGITIVGGLLVSQVLTLYTTPAVYLGMERVRAYVARRRRPRPTTAPVSP